MMCDVSAHTGGTQQARMDRIRTIDYRLLCVQQCRMNQYTVRTYGVVLVLSPRCRVRTWRARRRSGSRVAAQCDAGELLTLIIARSDRLSPLCMPAPLHVVLHRV
jgi:hypothetical protein